MSDICLSINDCITKLLNRPTTNYAEYYMFINKYIYIYKLRAKKDF